MLRVVFRGMARKVSQPKLKGMLQIKDAFDEQKGPKMEVLFQELSMNFTGAGLSGTDAARAKKEIEEYIDARVSNDPELQAELDEVAKRLTSSKDHKNLVDLIAEDEPELQSKLKNQKILNQKKRPNYAEMTEKIPKPSNVEKPRPPPKVEKPAPASQVNSGFFEIGGQRNFKRK